MWNRTINVKTDKTLGYQYFIDKEHPLANNNCGKVSYHRHVMSLHVGYWLSKTEHVHHIDGNRANNDINNLMLTNASEHARQHMTETMRDRGAVPVLSRPCKQCNKEFWPARHEQMFCSYECDKEFRKKFEVTKEELKELVWKMPTTHVAKIFKVSDKAIEKRCKKLGIEKPPRGYWEKLKHGHIKEEPINYSI